MKKLFVLSLTAILVINLYGCSTSEVENAPITVEENNESVTSQLTSDESPIVKEESTTPTQSTVMENDKANNNTPVTELSYEISDPFTTTIELEGTEETINCRTLISTLGYRIDYDMDRFIFSSENGIDSFVTENPDPQLYPYVYVNITRIDKDAEWEIEGVEAPQGFASKVYSDGMTWTPNATLATYNAEHIKLNGGSDWNSRISNYYFVVSKNYKYIVETQYFLEASEGYGARIDAMLKTFQIIE